MVKAFERFSEIEQNFSNEVEKQKEWLRDYKGIHYSKAEFEKHFMKWQTEKKLYESFDPAINCIGRHLKRLIIEFDDHNGEGEKDKEKIKENIEKTKQKLLDKGWGFIESTHKGASNYLWVEFTRDITSKEAEDFLKWIAPIGSEPDLNFASDKKVFQVMYARHWRHSNEREIPIGFWQGEQIDYDSLNIPKNARVPGIIKSITGNGFTYKTFVKEEKVMTNEENITDVEKEEGKFLIRMAYDEIIRIQKRFVVIPEEYYKIIGIWIIGTYLHPRFDTFPLLFLNAMRGSGKTRLLKLISALGAGGDGSIHNNLTEAVLFRIPKGTTTCIDEVEQIGNKEKQTLRELFNSAYKKGMKVTRMKKVKTNGQEKQVAEEFEPYFPIAMANINGLDEVLADRSITLIIEKSDIINIINKGENFTENSIISWIKATLMGFSRVVEFYCGKKHIEKWNFWLDNYHNSTNSTNTTYTTNSTNSTKFNDNKYYKELQRIKNEKIELTEDEIKFFERLNESGITGRNFELFMPMLLISKYLGEDVFEDIFSISKDLVKSKKKEEYEENTDASLFHFVVTLSDEDKYFNMKELKLKFKEYIGEGDAKDSWLTEKWLGRALKRLKLINDKRFYQGCSQVRLNYIKAREKLKIFL